MSAKQFSIAVVGASGAVGEALLAVLFERNFPIKKVYAVARGGENADGDEDTVLYAERPVLVESIAEFDFSLCELAFFCAPAAIAKKYAPKAVKAGCWVIDVSRQFRLDKKVPLVVPSVNGAVLDDFSKAKPQIIASPGAPIVQLASVLKPLADGFGLSSVDVTTLLAVSAKGRVGLSELAGQTARLLNAQAINNKTFPAQIAFNLIPAFDAPGESGYTLDEQGGIAELIKVLQQERLEVSLSEIFAPVFYGHSQVVRVRLEKPASVTAAKDALLADGSIEWVDVAEGPLTPVGIGLGSDTIALGRICQSGSESGDKGSGLTLWTVADNIRKGAAVNAVEIAETLLKSHL
ncbi:MAG: aspartate-semialdehyde dehydrogenase [Verrucomicrobiaceae bacterium]|nr:aspartate-semialdehyde dehydrogenase [Verrucomicrobiaceae bacterium]